MGGFKDEAPGAMQDGPVPAAAGLPLGFTPPASARLAGCSLSALVSAIITGDPNGIAQFRQGALGGEERSEHLIAALHGISRGGFADAIARLLLIDDGEDLVARAVLQVLALAADGRLRQAVALHNAISDRVKGAGRNEPGYGSDKALLQESFRCLQRADPGGSSFAGERLPAIFRLVLGYPRSGTTHLMQFLSFAFDTPTYSVYPGVSRHYSGRFFDDSPGHAVFLKDHVLRPEYLRVPVIAPVRDGRSAIISLARFLYAEGGSDLVRRGELADFISFTADRLPYGFWGGHTRALLEATDRGAAIRLVRYESAIADYPGLLRLAREIAGGDLPFEKPEADFVIRSGREKRRLAYNRGWQENIALPPDSFIPANWSIGGGTIDWRAAFDRTARRRFHELGGTEALIRLGYESDEDWWKTD